MNQSQPSSMKPALRSAKPSQDIAEGQSLTVIKTQIIRGETIYSVVHSWETGYQVLVISKAQWDRMTSAKEKKQ